MTTRRYPWKQKPTEYDTTQIDLALSSHLYLVHELGPTQFLISEEDSQVKYKVTIGEVQMCNGCSTTKKSTAASSSTSSQPLLCRHIFFVMLKILRLPRTDSLVWQTSLIDTEISNILSMRHRRLEEMRERRRRGRNASATVGVNTSEKTSASASSARVPPRPLDSDDVCPICQDDLREPVAGTEHTLQLVHCAYSCGAQLHAKCMRVWSEHQLVSFGATGKKLTCPMCRSEWCGANGSGEEKTNEQMVRELKEREHAPLITAKDHDGASSSSSDSTSLAPRASPPPLLTSTSTIKCISCRSLIPLSSGRFMRCVHCPDYNICRICFIRSKGVGCNLSGGIQNNRVVEGQKHVHCFVEAKPSEIVASHSLNEEKSSSTLPYAYGLDWMPSPLTRNIPSLTSHLALSLQSREITHADYELLLSLDEQSRNGGKVMMNVYLTKSLPMGGQVNFGQNQNLASTAASTSTCPMCSSTVLPSHSSRILPCSHVVHSTCLEQALMFDLLVKCPLDERNVFPGLVWEEGMMEKVRRRRKKKATMDESGVILGEAQRNVNASTLLFGLQGTGMMMNAPTIPTPSSFHSDVPDYSSISTIPSTSSSLISHSHHFSLSSSSLPAGAMQTIRDQRAATILQQQGRLRTGGTAAFAPSVAVNRAPTQQHAPPKEGLELSGASSFAPFVTDQHASTTAVPSHTTNTQQRKRVANRDRIAPIKHEVTDLNALAIDATPIDTTSQLLTHSSIRVRGSTEEFISLQVDSSSPPLSPSPLMIGELVDLTSSTAVAPAGRIRVGRGNAAAATSTWNSAEHRTLSIGISTAPPPSSSSFDSPFRSAAAPPRKRVLRHDTAPAASVDLSSLAIGAEVLPRAQLSNTRTTTARRIRRGMTDRASSATDGTESSPLILNAETVLTQTRIRSADQPHRRSTVPYRGTTTKFITSANINAIEPAKQDSRSTVLPRIGLSAKETSNSSNSGKLRFGPATLTQRSSAMESSLECIQDL